MSVTALVAGRLVAAPEQRTSANGKAFALARIAAATDDGDLLCSVIAFGHVGEQLAALAKGDSVAITGRAKVSTWSGREGEQRVGLNVTADAILTTYHVRRKREAMVGSSEGNA